MKAIDGRIDIAKDDVSGAIINIDQTAYQAAVNASKLREASKQQLESNTNDINSIKSELSEIKTMLRTLIDGR